jgi:hypothetical protein
MPTGKHTQNKNKHDQKANIKRTRTQIKATTDTTAEAKSQRKQNIRGREFNPGLPRDRRKY